LSPKTTKKETGGEILMKWKQLLTPAKNLETEEAKAYIAEHQEGTFTLLDVRQPAEYEQSHIPGARLIPLPDLPNRLEELDPEKPVIAY
jgi:rhodanese-related sulfurtransferase